MHGWGSPLLKVAKAEYSKGDAQGVTWYIQHCCKIDINLPTSTKIVRFTSHHHTTNIDLASNFTTGSNEPTALTVLVAETGPSRGHCSPAGTFGAACSLPQSMAWLKGKSAPETVVFRIEYGFFSCRFSR